LIQRLSSHLIKHWDVIAGGRWPRPRAIHWLKFGSVRDYPRSYAYFYLFLDRAPTPALVAKITADRTAKTQLVRDYDRVLRVRSRCGPEIAATVPTPIAGLPFGKFWVGLEEFAPGARFVPVVNLGRRGEPERVQGYVDRVVDWLIAFGRTGSERAPFDGDLYLQSVSEPLARLGRMHAYSGRERARLREVETRVAAWRGRPIRTTALHGDLWPGNIFFGPTWIRIIDWDGYRETDASYHDIYTFLTSFTLERPDPDRQGDPQAEFARTFFADHWFSRLARSALDRYARALELDPDLLQLMLPLYLARMATRREPVSEAAMAMNRKFAGLLSAYLAALAAGRAPALGPLPGPAAPARPAIGASSP
jgi:hypothetical protein